MKDFLINQCAKSVYDSNRGISKIDNDILSINGMSTPKVRHLMNNICSFDECKFLEVGTYMGSTLCSAAFNNNGSFIGVDNFSEFHSVVNPSHVNSQDNTRANLKKNIDSLNQKNISFYEKDFFNIDLNIKEKINVFFYDGVHTIEHQYSNLKIAKTFLDEYVVYIVDDFFCKVSKPKQASITAINDFKFEVLFYCELPENKNNELLYHGGLGVFVLKNYL
jgi:hypothetical protein